MLLRADDQPLLEAPDDDLVMRPLLRAEHGAGVSITHVRLDGVHRMLRTDRSTRVYYVIEGSATFSVGDDAPILATDGDVVVIPPGARYGFEGSLVYLVVNAPAYVAGDDVYDREA